MSVQKGTSLTWGMHADAAVTGTGVVGGIVQSIQRSDEAERADNRGADGKVVNVVYYNFKTILTVEILPTAAATLPAIGTTVTVAGSHAASTNSSYMVTAASINERVDGVVSFSLTLEKLEGINLS